MDKTKLTELTFLNAYDASQFEKPSVAADVVAFSIFSEDGDNYRKLPEQSLNILLIKRGEFPCKGIWALPGGFLQPHETIDETALRELAEETGVKDVYMEQLYTFSEIARDPRMRIISASYMALLYKRPELRATTDAADVSWFKVSYKILRIEKDFPIENQKLIKKTYYKLILKNAAEVLEADLLCTQSISHTKVDTSYEILNSKGIAFDHAKIIAFAIQRLRGKIEYTDVAFYLLPELFTLTKLQQIYEVILDKKLTPANFRRKIMESVVETSEIEEGGGYRNAKLFKRNMETL